MRKPEQYKVDGVELTLKPATMRERRTWLAERRWKLPKKWQATQEQKAEAERKETEKERAGI